MSHPIVCKTNIPENFSGVYSLTGKTGVINAMLL